MIKGATFNIKSLLYTLFVYLTLSSCTQENKWQWGTTDLWGSASTDSLKSATRNGFRWLEVNISANYQWGSDSNSINNSRFYLQRMRQKADSAGIGLWSGHLTYGNAADISQTDNLKRNIAVENLKNQILFAKEILGTKYFILHPSFEPISNAERPQRIQYAKESISILQSVADKIGATICVESLPRTCLGNTPEELMELIKGTNAKICYDVNHYSQGTVRHFINVTKEKIATLHLSDFDFKDEKHWLPGQGKIVWEELLALLEENGYEGVLMSEALKDRQSNKKITTLQLKLAYENILRKYNQ